MTEVRGVFAHSHAVNDPNDTYKEIADRLAQRFDVAVEALAGRRFSYRVVPANPGKFMVDFEPVPDSTQASA